MQGIVIVSQCIKNVMVQDRPFHIRKSITGLLEDNYGNPIAFREGIDSIIRTGGMLIMIIIMYIKKTGSGWGRRGNTLWRH